MQVRGCRPAEAPVLQQLAHASNNAERALWLDAVHLFVCLHQTYHSDPPAVPVSSSATMYRRQLYVRGAVTVAQNHPSTAEHMLRILKQVNRPNFAFVMDTGQVPMPLPLLLPLPTPCPLPAHSETTASSTVMIYLQLTGGTTKLTHPPQLRACVHACSGLEVRMLTVGQQTSPTTPTWSSALPTRLTCGLSSSR
jgi:hypothetical protein